MYIYPSSPESELHSQSEESAATKIQAGFRGYRVRKQLYRITKSNSTRTSKHISLPNAKHQLANSGQRQQSFIGGTMEGNQKHSPSFEEVERNSKVSHLNTVENQCATKIQAGFRGFLVRKKQKIATDAAVKIQSSFRGFKARKEAEKLKQT